MEANIAKFQSDLGKAVALAEASMNKISQAVDGAKNALESLGIGLGVYEIVEFEKEVIKATSGLEDMSRASGLSVQALSAIGSEAQRAGSNLDAVGGAFERMERNAVAATGGNQKMAAAFAAIGLSSVQVAEGLKNPDEFLLQVANHMAQFADDGNKAGIMMTLFGRSGADMANTLHQIAIDGYGASSATADQAEKMHELTVELAKFKESLAGSSLNFITDTMANFAAIGPTVKAGFSNVLISIEEGFDLFFEHMRAGWTAFSSGAQNAAAAIAKLTGLAFTKTPEIDDSAERIRRIKEVADARIAENNRVIDEARKTYAQRNDLTEIQVTAKRILPTGPLPSIVPPLQGDALKGMKQTLDAVIKTLNEAIKAEDAILKVGNMTLDRDYANGIVSLANYSAERSALMQASYDTTQRIYGQEIAAAVAYYNKVTDQQQKIAALEKIKDLAGQKEVDSIKNMQDQIALTTAVQAESAKLAKSILDTAVAYATMNGQTELANALSTTMQDGAKKQLLLINGQTDALEQLAAIEANSALNSSRNGVDGMTRSIIAYQKSLADVAKQTESITTKMLTGMEDALVAFVTTGKLNFSSLINSFIADLARLAIRQQVMPWIAQLFGLIGGGASGVSTSGFNAELSGIGTGLSLGAAAGGGYVTVGERGPEKFVPGTSGTIVPAGAGGGMNVTYAPVIQIDARSDRAQVQAETAAAVRRGNRDLISSLMRYNPQLKM